MTDFTFIDAGDRWIIFSDALKYRKEAYPRVVLVEGKIADVGCATEPGLGRFANPFAGPDFDEHLAEAVIRFYLYEVLGQEKDGILMKLGRIIRPTRFSGHLCFRGLSDIPQTKLAAFQRNITEFGLFSSLHISETPTPTGDTKK